MNDPGSTRNRILDQAEARYADAGLSGFSLRDITDGAGVNLAAVNYHFQTRKSLIKAMLLRALQPIAIERRGLLGRVRALHPHSLQPTHVIICLLVPLLRDLVCPQSPHQTAFTVRVSSDPDAWIREVMADTFAAVGAEYEQAFADSASGIGRAESLLRTALLCNVIPGNVVNHSIIVMCQRLLEDNASSSQSIMNTFASLAEMILTSTVNTPAIALEVSEMLNTLRHTPAVYAIENEMINRHALQN